MRLVTNDPLEYLAWSLIGILLITAVFIIGAVWISIQTWIEERKTTKRIQRKYPWFK